MTKKQQKILGIVYSNGSGGIGVEAIAKSAKSSVLSLHSTLRELVEASAIEELPGSIYKPSEKKLKML
jgi:hypothetical protein